MVSHMPQKQDDRVVNILSLDEAKKMKSKKVEMDTMPIKKAREVEANYSNQSSPMLEDGAGISKDKKWKQ